MQKGMLERRGGNREVLYGEEGWRVRRVRLGGGEAGKLGERRWGRQTFFIQGFTEA